MALGYENSGQSVGNEPDSSSFFHPIPKVYGGDVQFVCVLNLKVPYFKKLFLKIKVGEPPQMTFKGKMLYSSSHLSAESIPLLHSCSF